MHMPQLTTALVVSGKGHVEIISRRYHHLSYVAQQESEVMITILADSHYYKFSK